MFRILTLAALATSATAFAEDKPAEKAPATETAKETSKFDKLDVDKDKKLSMVEVAAVADLSESFTTVDADADGSLSRAEYDAWAKVAPKADAEKTAAE